MCQVLGKRSSVGVLALPFRQTKPFLPSCHSRKSFLSSILTVLNACFSIKLRITVWSQSMHVKNIKKFVHIYIRYVYTLQKQVTSQEFAYEHVFKGLNDR